MSLDGYHARQRANALENELRARDQDLLRRLLGEEFPGAGLSDLPPAPAPELDLEVTRVSPVPASDQAAVRDLLARVGVTPIPCPACNADDGDHHQLCPTIQDPTPTMPPTR